MRSRAVVTLPTASSSAVRSLAGVFQLLGHGFRDRRHEGAVDLGIEGRGADVGDLRSDRVRLLVHEVLQRRAGEVARRDADEVAAEVLGDDDRGITASAADSIHRLVLVDELPAELVVLLELVDELAAHIDVARELGGGALVLIDDRDADVLRVRIRIPERDDVEPRVQGRSDDHADDDDPRLAHAGQPADIAREDAQRVVHRAPSGAFLGMSSV